MKNNTNGISPILAFVLTILVAFLTIHFFTKGQIFWGIIFAVICVDFCADFLLSLKKS